MEREPYEGYFSRQYGYSYTVKDVEAYRRWIEQTIRFFRRRTQDLPAPTLLEVGCGLGVLSDMGLHTERYVGLEMDELAVRFAQGHFGARRGRSFVHSSLEAWASPDQFDVVVALEVLEHVEDPRRFLRHLREHLVPGGTLLISTPYPWRKNVVGDASHLYVLHPENWRRLLLEAGFVDVRHSHASFVPGLWRLNESLNKVLPVTHPFPGISTVHFWAR